MAGVMAGTPMERAWGGMPAMEAVAGRLRKAREASGASRAGEISSGVEGFVRGPVVCRSGGGRAVGLAVAGYCGVRGGVGVGCGAVDGVAEMCCGVTFRCGDWKRKRSGIRCWSCSWRWEKWIMLASPFFSGSFRFLIIGFPDAILQPSAQRQEHPLKGLQIF